MASLAAMETNNESVLKVDMDKWNWRKIMGAYRLLPHSFCGLEPKIKQEPYVESERVGECSYFQCRFHICAEDASNNYLCMGCKKGMHGRCMRSALMMSFFNADDEKKDVPVHVCKNCEGKGDTTTDLRLVKQRFKKEKLACDIKKVRVGLTNFHGWYEGFEGKNGGKCFCPFGYHGQSWQVNKLLDGYSYATYMAREDDPRKCVRAPCSAVQGDMRSFLTP